MSDPINNQPRAFGYCKFENAEGVLRAVRLLNDFELDGKNLLVKVDDNTKKYLEEYQAKKAAAEGKS